MSQECSRDYAWNNVGIIFLSRLDDIERSMDKRKKDDLISCHFVTPVTLTGAFVRLIFVRFPHEQFIHPYLMANFCLFSIFLKDKA